jgi:hypothetical protein
LRPPARLHVGRCSPALRRRADGLTPPACAIAARTKIRPRALSGASERHQPSFPDAGGQASLACARS